MSASATAPTRIRVSDMGDLVALTPHLLGFQPSESLVLVVMVDHKIAVTARVDADISDGDLLTVFRQILDRFPSAEFLALTFTEDAEIGRRLEDLLPRRPEVQDFVLVTGGEWRSRGAQGVVDSAMPAACEAIVAGMPVRRSRAELEALVTPRPGVREYAWRRDALADALRDVQPDKLDIWLKAARETASPDALGLAGLAAWMGGDGALMNVCLERMPADHRLAKVLDLVNRRVIPPEQAPAVIATAIELVELS